MRDIEEHGPVCSRVLGVSSMIYRQIWMVREAAGESLRGDAIGTVWGAARGTATETIRSAARGAATLEAAIVLPLLLCAFFSVVFLVKTVYTYSLIQHAISETATEIASAGYIYHISGIRDLHDIVGHYK